MDKEPSETASHRVKKVEPRADQLRQRTRTMSDFCFTCDTPWTLTGESRNGLWVVFCTRCETVRPPRRDLIAPAPW